MSNEKNTREQRLAAAMKRLDKEGPLPGMISAFEQQFGQTWTDREWRSETSVWACAWRAAISAQRQAEPEDDGGYYSEEADDIYQTRRRAEVTDAQRLDWCQENLVDVFQDVGEGFWIGYLDGDGRHQTSSRCPTLREAIDAAMQK